MILIDALYVNYGGALGLLKYLVEKIQDRDMPFFLLADARCSGIFDTISHVAYMEASEKNRRQFYVTNKIQLTSVFCFGNVPPPVRLNVPVYTYFHNVNMLTLTDCRDIRQLIKFWLKRTYIKFRRKNTDEWFVQTTNTYNELTQHLEGRKEKVKIFPFYKLPTFPRGEKPRTDYVFVGEFSGSKGHKELLEAWKILYQQGIDLTLHLTVSLGDDFLKDMQVAIGRGLRIVNHGFIPASELAELYMQCKATIYPSYNESFGLGLVEAIEAGCDVIASDRPFVHAICYPSELFEPSSASSIADAVIRYEQQKMRETRLLVRDMIEELITRISAMKNIL